MNSYLLLYCSVMFLSISCMNNNRESKDTIPISFKIQERQELDITKYYSSSEFIQIDTTLQIGSVSYVKYLNGIFYLLDQSSQNIVLINAQGKWVNTIGTRGRASNEYIHLTSFDVNPFDGNVFVYDQRGRKIIVYDTYGKALRTIFLEENMNPRDIAVMNDNDILCCTYAYDGPYVKRGVWSIDSSGHFKSQLVSVPNWNRFDIVTTLPLFSRIDDKTIGIVGCSGDDKVYHIHADGHCVAEYSLSFDETLKKRDLLFDPSQRLPDKYFVKYFYAESQRLLHLVSNGAPHLYAYLIYDKKDRHGHVLHHGDSFSKDMFYIGVLGCSYDKEYMLIDLRDCSKEEYTGIPQLVGKTGLVLAIYSARK